MEVLKHGKQWYLKDNPQTQICDFCNCVFKYNEDEIEREEFPCFSRTLVKITVKCPECGNEVLILQDFE